MNLLKNCDMLGPPVTLMHNGRTHFKTILGGAISILIACAAITYAVLLILYPIEFQTASITTTTTTYQDSNSTTQQVSNTTNSNITWTTITEVTQSEVYMEKTSTFPEFEPVSEKGFRFALCPSIEYNTRMFFMDVQGVTNLGLGSQYTLSECTPSHFPNIDPGRLDEYTLGECYCVDQPDFVLHGNTHGSDYYAVQISISVCQGADCEDHRDIYPELENTWVDIIALSKYYSSDATTQFAMEYIDFVDRVNLEAYEFSKSEIELQKYIKTNLDFSNDYTYSVNKVTKTGSLYPNDGSIAEVTFTMGPKITLLAEKETQKPLMRNLLIEEPEPEAPSDVVYYPPTNETSTETEVSESSNSSPFPGFYALFVFSQVGGFIYLSKTIFSCFFSLFYAFRFKLEIISNFSNLRSKYDSENLNKGKKSKNAIHTKSFHSKADRMSKYEAGGNPSTSVYFAGTKVGRCGWVTACCNWYFRSKKKDEQTDLSHQVEELREEMDISKVLKTIKLLKRSVNDLKKMPLGLKENLEKDTKRRSLDPTPEENHSDNDEQETPEKKPQDLEESEEYDSSVSNFVSAINSGNPYSNPPMHKETKRRITMKKSVIYQDQARDRDQVQMDEESLKGEQVQPFYAPY